MKSFGAFLAVVLVTVFLGCGAGDETATSADTGSADGAVSENTQSWQEGDFPVPSVPPQEDPLKELIVTDLVKGKGPAAHRGDEVTIRYVGSFYESGTVFVQNWESPEQVKLDGKTYGRGMQEGLEGMRVGGEREILIPRALYFNDGDDSAYVVALDRISPGATN